MQNNNFFGIKIFLIHAKLFLIIETQKNHNFKSQRILFLQNLIGPTSVFQFLRLKFEVIASKSFYEEIKSGWAQLELLLSKKRKLYIKDSHLVLSAYETVKFYLKCK